MAEEASQGDDYYSFTNREELLDELDASPFDLIDLLVYQDIDQENELSNTEKEDERLARGHRVAIFRGQSNVWYVLDPLR